MPICIYTDQHVCFGEDMVDELWHMTAAEQALWEMAILAPSKSEIVLPIVDKAYEVQRKRIAVETALGQLDPCSTCKESK